MKKFFILIFSILFLATISAEKTLNIFKNNLSVLNTTTSTIDSIKFNDSNLILFQSNNNTQNISLTDIDSINFSETTQQMLVKLKLNEISSILNSSANALFTIESTGGTTITEIGVCWSTTENPDITNSKIISSSNQAVNSINITGLSASTNYYARAYAINATGTAYSNQLSFSTTNYTLPSVETVSATYNYNSNAATCVVKVNSNGGCDLTERGICWSTTQNPTITNSKYSNGTSVGQFYAMMSGLNVNSTYYVRAFASNCLGTSYGAQIKVQALMGNVTYTLAVDKNTNPTEYNLIKIAMDSACWYYNRYTNFKGNVYVYYNAGIPTAQASYHGSLGFGPNSRYMWVGTAIHEMAHYVGSGTTSAWKSKIVNNVWTGTTATELLKSTTGETLKGDSQHFWPYGINQKEEVTNKGDAEAQKNAMILTVKLVKAMCVDDAKLPTSW